MIPIPNPEYGIALKKCPLPKVTLRCPFCGVLNNFDDEFAVFCTNISCDEMIYRSYLHSNATERDKVRCNFRGTCRMRLQHGVNPLFCESCTELRTPTPPVGDQG